MSNPAMVVYRDFADSSEIPITNLTGVATLTGGNSYLITGTTKYLFRPSQGRTSTGAQADGPSASTAVARGVGGAIEDGVYACFFTFWNGAESLAGAISTVTVATSGANTGSIVHTLPSFPQDAVWAYGYRQKDASGHFYRFATIDDLTQTTYIDTQVESAISGNPEPATSAPPAGRLTFQLAAPDDLSDPSNVLATIYYTIIIDTQTFYTTSFVYSGSPVELGTILSVPPSTGILTRIYWDDGFASEAPLAGKVARWRINQDCFATDTGIQLFASQPTLSLPADSLGQGEIWLKPQLRTSTGAAGFYYAQLIQDESYVWAVQVPLPDSVTGGTLHPNGFAFSELSPLLVGLPGVQVASIDQVLADIAELDNPQKNPLTSGDSAELELINVRERLRNDMGLAVGHWKDARISLIASGAIQSTAGNVTATLGSVVAGGAFLRGRHCAGFPETYQVSIAVNTAVAGSGATLTTIGAGVEAGDMHGDGLVLTCGSAPTSGKLLTITYHDAYTKRPTYLPAADDGPTKALDLYCKTTTTTAELWCAVAPDASAAYTFGWVSQGF